MPASASAGRCHTEHKGRAADIVQLDRADFAHRYTDFALEGAHADLDCALCHKPGLAWRKAPATCAGCHKADDVHKGQLRQSCGECHGAASWTGGKFDHDKTDFKLTGAHVPLSCNACHIAGRYAQTPKSCNGCHATDDEHRGARGTDCAKCHVTKEWKTAKYDHLKETGYELAGRARSHHLCRVPPQRQSKGQDSEGLQRLPPGRRHACGSLRHPIAPTATATKSGRSRTTTMPASTNLRWTDAHARIDCYACHTAVAARQKLAKDCAGCHRSEDAHGGKLQGGCDSCHGQSTWRSDIVFDHDLTKYPLLGLHRVASCAQCHHDRGLRRRAHGLCRLPRA